MHFSFHIIIFYNIQTNIPIFNIKDSSVRRRYRDFEWLKKELERDRKVCIHCKLNSKITIVISVQIVVPPLPGKAIKRQLPFRGDDGQ